MFVGSYISTTDFTSSRSYKSLAAEEVCKIVHLHNNGCFNLIWVWGIQICRDINSPSPLVAIIFDSNMAVGNHAFIVLWPSPFFNTEWEMIGGKGFFAVLSWSGPLLIGSTVCVRHILGDWPPKALKSPENTVRSPKY